MKKTLFRAFVLSSILFVFISCKKEELATAVIDTNQIKEEIQAKENEFADVYNAGIEKSIGYHADDAITYPQNSQPIVGKTAIVAFLKTHRDSLAVGNKISFKTNEVFVSNDANQVVEIGYYRVVDSSDITVNSGNYMSLFVKKDGKYECLRDMSTSDLPNK
jgi:ketosteroid isomerase-like protein